MLFYNFFLYFMKEENIGIVKISDFRILTGLLALGCPEHDLTIFTKCLSVCVCDKIFVASLARELIDRIS